MRNQLMKFAEQMGAALRERLESALGDLRKEMLQRDEQHAKLEASMVHLAEGAKLWPDAASFDKRLSEAVEPLLAKIAELQKQLDAPPAPLPDFELLVSAEVERRLEAVPLPKDGKDVDMGEVENRLSVFVAGAEALLTKHLAAFDEAATGALASLPAPQKGDAGEPGKSVTLEDVRPLVDDALATLLDEQEKRIAEGLAAIRQPEDGKSVTLDEVAPMITDAVAAIRLSADKAVAEAVAAIPAPAKGDRGDDGKSVTPEEMLPHVKAWFSDWALGFERNAAEVLERAALRIPTPKDGRDGFGFEELSVVQVDERTVALEFRRGDDVKQFKIEIPGFIYRNVYREDQPYAKGDSVTRGGSLWIAQRAVAPGEAPGRNEDAWQLAVKKGAPGDKGEPGKNGEPGRRGDDGKNYDGSRG